MNKERLLDAISALAGLVQTLRGPDGCPWDARQTDSTLKMYLLEEAYEVLEAIESGLPDDVCQELGDLLFQILFLARLAEERGEFDLIEVMEGIHKKMVHRHPHVFGEVEVKGASEVSRNWAEIKKQEKGYDGSASSALEDVPANLPALLRAHRLDERASKAGLDGKGEDKAWEKVTKRFAKFADARNRKDRDEIGEEMGRLLVTLVHFARQWDLNAENLLREANRTFIRRFAEMEEEFRTAGKDLSEVTPEELVRVWEKTKAENGR